MSTPERNSRRVVNNNTVEHSILNLLDQNNEREFSIKDMEELLSLSKSSFSSALATNIRKGKIIRVKRGIYKLNPSWRGNVLRKNK